MFLGTAISKRSAATTCDCHEREQACSTCVSFRFFAEQQLERETERLWENWLVTKSAFPSPRCDMSCARLVGAARSGYTRETPGSQQFARVLKRAARPDNVQPNPPNPPQPNPPQPPQPNPPQPNPPQPNGGGNGGVDVETVDSDEESVGSNNPPQIGRAHV